MTVNDSFDRTAVLWGVVSISIISFLSLSGAAILPLIRGKSRSRWMSVFIALAVATLSSDAILHIIPQVLGVHGDHDHSAVERGNNTHETAERSVHDFTAVDNITGVEHHHAEEHGHSHEHEDGISEKEVLIKLSALMFAVYAMYIVEFIASRGKQHNHKVHDHDTSSNHSNAAWTDVEKASQQIIDRQSKPSALASEPVICFGLRSTAMMILFGDGVHNFIDGVAVGASFAISPRLGLTTSIAVVCHEIPHEIGDFAVLLEGGLSVRRALLLNLISAFTAFGGLFVGLAAITINSAVEWLLALTAGMFLYVAWLDMLVHLRSEANEDDPWYLTLALQSIGFIGGFAIIFLIGWFEDDILAM